MAFLDRFAAQIDPDQPLPPIKPRKTRHALHAVLTLVTFGLWAPFWAYSAWLNHGSGKYADYSQCQGFGQPY